MVLALVEETDIKQKIMKNLELQIILQVSMEKKCILNGHKGGQSYRFL